MAENHFLEAVLDNRTSEELLPGSSHLAWGKFVNVPIAIRPSESASAFKASGASGSATGTEGFTQFSIGNTGETFTIAWDIPYTGDNTFRESASGGFLLARGSTPTHDNGCKITYTLTRV